MKIFTKQLKIKLTIFEHTHERILAHTFHFHYIGMIQSVKKSYYFVEKFLLLLVQSRQHFLHNHSFNNLSWSFVIHSVNISKRTLSKPLFHCQCITIKAQYVNNTFLIRFPFSQELWKLETSKN